LVIVISFLPLWFRFAQCLSKYRETKLSAHFINAGKYLIALFVPLFALWVTKHKFDIYFWVYISIRSVSTLYSFFWDLYMDWGLLRSRALSKFALRDKVLFPVWFYYWAVLSNFLLRFFWLIWLWRDFDITYGKINLTNEL